MVLVKIYDKETGLLIAHDRVRRDKLEAYVKGMPKSARLEYDVNQVSN